MTTRQRAERSFADQLRELQEGIQAVGDVVRESLRESVRYGQVIEVSGTVLDRPTSATDGRLMPPALSPETDGD